VTKSEWQKHWGFTDDEVDQITKAIKMFSGIIININTIEEQKKINEEYLRNSRHRIVRSGFNPRSN
jgi:hypothetical protein